MYILVHTRTTSGTDSDMFSIYLYIPVHTSMTEYMPISKNVHNFRIRTEYLMHTLQYFYRYATRVIALVLKCICLRYIFDLFLLCVTLWLVADVRRRSSRVSGSGHDIAGPGPGLRALLQWPAARRVLDMNVTTATNSNETIDIIAYSATRAFENWHERRPTQGPCPPVPVSTDRTPGPGSRVWRHNVQS